MTGAHITRDYHWWKAIGVRGSFEDDGLTFGTNTDGGVCVHFRDKVKGPMRRSWSALTVTVADLDGLVAALHRTDRRCSDGRRVRPGTVFGPSRTSGYRYGCWAPRRRAR